MKLRKGAPNQRELQVRRMDGMKGSSEWDPREVPVDGGTKVKWSLDIPRHS